MSFRALIAAEQLQFMVFFGLSLGVISLSVIAYIANPLQFQRFLGSFNPLAVITLLAVAGGIFLSILLARNWFSIWIPGQPNRFILAVSLAVFMAGVMIFVDIKVVFHRDLNVLFPRSLMYYPVIDYGVQMLFHVLPLSLLLLLITTISNLSYDAVIWPCLCHVYLEINRIRAPASYFSTCLRIN